MNKNTGNHNGYLRLEVQANRGKSYGKQRKSESKIHLYSFIKVKGSLY